MAHWGTYIMSDLRNYLEAMVSMRKTINAEDKYDYAGMEDLVLVEGQQFGYDPDLYQEYVLEHKGQKKACYHNAYTAALMDKDLIYAEGYACSGGIGIAMMHAWCVHRKSLSVIELTWDSGIAYHGIPFKTEYVGELLDANGEYGVLDNWRQNYPLITGEHNIKEKRYE